MSLSGCSSETGKLSTGNKVDQVIQKQIEESDYSDGNMLQELLEEENSVVEFNANSKEQIHNSNATYDIVDYDLTTMDSDMVYVMVYQLMTNSSDYIGKTIRMKGNYYASYYEPTGKYYHYVIVQDATACCAQGMEFIWEDGNHIYPDEYPKDEEEIVVTGIFETYREEGEESLYCRLKDAMLER